MTHNLWMTAYLKLELNQFGEWYTIELKLEIE